MVVFVVLGVDLTMSGGDLQTRTCTVVDQKTTADLEA